ncbi:ribosome biogenesis GTPase YlqF [Terrilactibacillus sp. BCM23-1]|uniref:Ribosome biogenesis GTPase A n=1 Tax=Terrilactibacillus tamarindi TaxID=2599694 RepID=A0A6N8CTJ5_9BACI|nr:ribosome biogenesis GTPase YlqF [Terrilactibacillus tamarindi]MTT32295.1 ribosome biogenesis GTPase YlqF [Terrilactibacillus tamarindi]
MSIQWYPGHMAKAKRQMIEKIKLIDVVIELVDARIPESSRNPLVDEISSGKPRILILNKVDMADDRVTTSWAEKYEDQGYSVLKVNAQTGAGTKSIPDLVHRLTADKRAKLENKGFNSRSDRALILGIPNVGKSTLINRLANKKIAKIGNRPGITTAQQWIKVGKTMELLDTPGILWPKFEDQSVGLKLAATGAIKDDLLDFQDVSVFLLKCLLIHYPHELRKRYDLHDLPLFEVEPTVDDIVTVIDDIGKRRGCMMSGGYIDYDRTAELIIREFRGEKLGKITLERPE